MTHYRFEDYHIDVAAGRVHRHGVPVPLQPRPLALLVHLIQERRRVVPTDELLRRFWRGAPDSRAALARALLKLRRALPGRDGAEIVRTVGRVGYRFVAPLAGDANADTAAQAAAQAGTIALLPVRNATGDAALGWLELGLMALAVRELETRRVLPVAAIPSVMTAMDGARHAGDPSVDAAVRRATGAHTVVHARVVRGHGGELSLVYEAHGTAPLRGSVACARPTELAVRFADALVQALAPSAPARPPRVAHDPLADEAFARGLQALTAHHWSRAANLFRMALDLEPERTDVQVEQLRALGNLGDLGLLGPARRLLAQAARTQDTMLAAHVHQALGRLHLNRSELAQADHHLGLSLECAQGQGSPDWTARTLMLQAGAAADRMDYATALQIAGRMYAQCERSGDRILPIAGRIFEANATAAGGNLEQAVVLLFDATRQAREVRATSFLNAACDSAAWYLAKLGRLGEAAVHAEEAVAVALSDGTATNAWRAMPALCWIYRLAGTPQAGRRAMERLPDPTDLPCPEHAWRARALLAAAEGRHGEAADDLSRAVQRQREQGHLYDEEQTLPWLVDALVRCGRLAEAQAELDAASAPRLAGLADLQVQLLHGRASLAHARGAAQAAIDCLTEVADTAAAPLWRAWARIDLAWLQARAGDADAATRTLAGVPPVLAGHPLVRTVRAGLQAPPAPGSDTALPTRR